MGLRTTAAILLGTGSAVALLLLWRRRRRLPPPAAVRSPPKLSRGQTSQFLTRASVESDDVVEVRPRSQSTPLPAKKSQVRSQSIVPLKRSESDNSSDKRLPSFAESSGSLEVDVPLDQALDSGPQEEVDSEPISPIPTPQPSFHPDDYSRIKLLGRGASGEAYLMRRGRDGGLCVCKHISLAVVNGRPSDIGALNEVIPSEVAILASLDHPHVVKYLASSVAPAEVRIWMEYAPGGSLDQTVQRQAQLRIGFSSPRVCTWAIQLADALEHVHSRRVLHRDLKTANIFLTHSGDVKLGDFGVARSNHGRRTFHRLPRAIDALPCSSLALDALPCLSIPQARSFTADASTSLRKTSLASTTVGTPYYMAPELIHSQPYGVPSDNWSLGVVLYELLTLRRPFDASNLGALVLSISSCAYDEAALRNCPHDPQLSALASRTGLLHLEPAKRLTIEGLRVAILEWLWSDETEAEAEAVAERLTGASPRGQLKRNSLIDMIWQGGQPDSSSTAAQSGPSSAARPKTPTTHDKKPTSPAPPPREDGSAAPGQSATQEAAADGQGGGQGEVKGGGGAGGSSDEDVDESASEARRMARARSRPRAPTFFEAAPPECKTAELLEALQASLAEAGRIHPLELEKEDHIGSGGFGAVHKATWTPSKRPAPSNASASASASAGGSKRSSNPSAAPSSPVEAGGSMAVAVKTLTMSGTPHKALKALCQEASLLCAARHPNIVSIFGLCVQPDASLSLVMEFLEGGSLFNFIHPNYKEPRAAAAGGGGGGGRAAPTSSDEGVRMVLVDGVRLVRLMRDCAEGVAFLHARGIIHRDLKSANLLLDASCRNLKVCDFGLSREAFLTAKMTRVGSVQWAAPEVMLGVAYGPRADVWSFGVVLWELCTGRVPFEGIPRAQLARMIALENRRLPIPPMDARRCPIQVLRLMAVCFRAEAERPHFHEISHILEACAPVVGRFGEVHDVMLSKRLTQLLRHKALEVGVPIDDSGWVRLSEALRYVNHQQATNRLPTQTEGRHDHVLHYTEEDVLTMVRLNDKKRFEMRPAADGGGLQIRCSYGHTMELPEVGVDTWGMAD